MHATLRSHLNRRLILLLILTALPQTVRAAEDPSNDRPRQTSVSEQSIVLLEPKVSGLINPADRTELEQAATSALQLPRLRVISSAERDGVAAAFKIERCYRNECLEQMGRLLGAQLALAYKIDSDALPSDAGKGAASWRIAVALYDLDVGGVGASLESTCERCSVTMVSEALATLIRRAVQEDTSKPRQLLEIMTEPRNSSVVLDGVEVGVTPYRHIAFAGKHDLTIRHTGHRSLNQEILILENRTTMLNLQLEVGQDQIRYFKEYGPRPKWRLAVGGALVGLGLVGIGVGALGLGINGQCVDPPVPPMMFCSDVYRGTPGGLGFVISGAIVAIGGAVTMALPGPRNPLPREMGPEAFESKDKLVAAQSEIGR